ncbi:MAG TPA: hypothetical protein VFI80_06510 [Burkholderiales bacterium]|nr:hypothetical protein [Burkholderiales bacterium]
MTASDGDDSRRDRTHNLRRSWRRNAAPGPSPEPPASDDPHQKRRTRALDSNDRIRAEAPDDLETRRRADQLEREIKRTPGARRGSPRTPPAR